MTCEGKLFPTPTLCADENFLPEKKMKLVTTNSQMLGVIVFAFCQLKDSCFVTPATANDLLNWAIFLSMKIEICAWIHLKMKCWSKFPLLLSTSGLGIFMHVELLPTMTFKDKSVWSFFGYVFSLHEKLVFKNIKLLILYITSIFYLSAVFYSAEDDLNNCLLASFNLVLKALEMCNFLSSSYTRNDTYSTTHARYKDVGPYFEGLYPILAKNGMKTNLWAQQLGQESYTGEHQYESTYSMTLVMPTDSFVVNSLLRVYVKDVDLKANESGCSPGFLRLVPIEPSIWHETVLAQDDGTTYLLHIPWKQWTSRRTSLVFQSEWPTLAEEFFDRDRKVAWPDDYVMKKIRKEGCHVAPFKSSKMFWQYKFDVADKLLTASLSEERKRCFHFLKVIMDSFLIGGGYRIRYSQLKALFFYCCEQLDDKIFRNQGNCIMIMLTKLRDYVRAGFLPSYFIREVNLLRGLNSKDISQILSKLDTARVHTLLLLYFTADDLGWLQSNAGPKVDSILLEVQAVFQEPYSGNRCRELVQRICAREVQKFAQLGQYTKAIDAMGKAGSFLSSQLSWFEFVLFVNKGLPILQRWCLAFCKDIMVDRTEFSNFVGCGTQSISMAEIFGENFVDEIGEFQVPAEMKSDAYLFHFVCSVAEILIDCRRYNELVIGLRWFVETNECKIRKLFETKEENVKIEEGNTLSTRNSCEAKEEDANTKQENLIMIRNSYESQEKGADTKEGNGVITKNSLESKEEDVNTKGGKNSIARHQAVQIYFLLHKAYCLLRQKDLFVEFMDDLEAMVDECSVANFHVTIWQMWQGYGNVERANIALIKSQSLE